MYGYIDDKFILLTTLSTCKDVALDQLLAMIDIGSVGCGPSHAERTARSLTIMVAQSLHTTCHKGSVLMKTGREAINVKARQKYAASRGAVLRKACHRGYSLLPASRERCCKRPRESQQLSAKADASSV